MTLYKLIAADMDDTLLNPQGKLSPRTLSALKRAMDAGAYMVLASGRMLEAMRKFADEAQVNAPVILYNGGMVYDLKKQAAISRLEIPCETAKAICRMAEDQGIYIQAYPGEGYFAAEHTKYTDLYENHIKVPCGITGKKLSEWITTGQVKMLMIGEIEDTMGYVERFSKAFPEVSFMKSRPNYVEIVAKNVDKRFALEATLNSLGVKKEECLVFGDGQNDLSMLLYAGAGYCMRNAKEEVRAQCRLFAPSNAEDGCAQIIEEMLDKGLIGKE